MQFVISPQTRFVVGVGGDISNSDAEEQRRICTHTRSDVSVGDDCMVWPLVQFVVDAQTVSLVDDEDDTWYCQAVHDESAAQTRFDVAVGETSEY